MPNPKDMHVTVHLQLGQVPNFYLTYGGKKLGQKENIVFKNDRHPGFNVHFTLDPDTAGDYKWPRQPDIKQAVWSKMGETGCPNMPIYDVFEPKHVSGDRSVLSVYNPNYGKCVGMFRYTLRCIDSKGDWLDLDPGGDNQNGSIGRNINISFLVIAGAAAGVAASYLANSELVATAALTYGLGGAVLGAIVGFLLRSM